VKVKKTAAVQEAKETTEARKSADNVDSIINAIERMLFVDKEVSTCPICSFSHMRYCV